MNLVNAHTLRFDTCTVYTPQTEIHKVRNIFFSLSEEEILLLSTEIQIQLFCKIVFCLVLRLLSMASYLAEMFNVAFILFHLVHKFLSIFRFWLSYSYPIASVSYTR